MVVDPGGRLVGLVTQADLLAALAGLPRLRRHESKTGGVSSACTHTGKESCAWIEARNMEREQLGQWDAATVAMA